MGPISVAACSRRNRTPDKPCEDAYAVRLAANDAVLVVVDGVTRSRSAAGIYPQPSGATLAADLVASTLVNALAGGADPGAAFTLASQAVDAANRRNGVWDRLDYVEHDLWGAVATAVVVSNGVARWAHIGDTVLLHLPAAGGVSVRTPDQVSDAMLYLERMTANQLAAVGGREFYARRTLRNQPASAHSYGVLTGEAAAESYVVTGTFAVAGGDLLMLGTDGLGSLRGSDADAGWHSLEPWLRGEPSNAALTRLLDAVEEVDERQGIRSDDKTLILAQIAPGD
ncbi:MAG TPA: protein phosphatase 2C domain-containing protein [Chloroflexota bacterium]